MPYLKWLCLSLLTYVGVVFVVRLPWHHMLGATLVPSFQRSRESMTAVVAIFGTTISPYLFFWQAAEEVEEQKNDSRLVLRDDRDLDVRGRPAERDPRRSDQGSVLECSRERRLERGVR